MEFRPLGTVKGQMTEDQRRSIIALIKQKQLDGTPLSEDDARNIAWATGSHHEGDDWKQYVSKPLDNQFVSLAGNTTNDAVATEATGAMADGEITAGEFDAIKKKYGLTGIDSSIFDMLGKEEYSTNGLVSDAEIAKMVSGAATELELDAKSQAELDVNTSYDLIKYNDLEQTKTQMADLRQAASMYKQEEAQNYKQKLQTTKEALRARNATFSGSARRELGKESGVGAQDQGSAFVEGNIPTDRRQAWGRANNSIQQSARDIGRQAELRYGSVETDKVQREWGAVDNPYDGKSLDYQEGRKTASYEANKKLDGIPAPDYVASGKQLEYAPGSGTASPRYAATYDRDKQAALKVAKNNRMYPRN